MSQILPILNKHIEKEARLYLGTVVEAMILEVETKVFSDVIDAISMPAMIGMIEIDGVERAALIDLDLDLVYHVVDLRLGGLPSEHPEFTARRPTPIDNEICTALVDIALEGLTIGLAEAFGADDAIEMRCTGFEHLPMQANIVTESADVLCVQVSLDIGEAARSGNFTLVLPFSSLDRVKAVLQRNSNVSTASATDAWAQHMLDVVLDTEIELTPVLHATTLSVGQLAQLEVGQTLRLDAEAHHHISLQLPTNAEPVEIATARLGALKDSKALKLISEPNPSFLAPMRAVAEHAIDEPGV